jgi:hypothetical protein
MTHDGRTATRPRFPFRSGFVFEKNRNLTAPNTKPPLLRR